MKSNKFYLLKEYYLAGYWSDKMLKNAVGKLITEQEYQEIINSK